MGYQLTLGLKLGSRATFSNFVVGENTAVVRFLEEAISSREPIAVNLWGVHGAGKTHLLQAACQRLVYQGFQAGYIDLAQLTTMDLLKGLLQLKLVCLDHLDTIKDEEHLKILVEFIQTSLKKGHQIFLASQKKFEHPLFKQVPLNWQHLLPLDKDGMSEALHIKAAEQGLCIPQDVEDLLISQSKNSMQRLVTLLTELEQVSAQQKKKVTLAFVKGLLKDKEAP